VRAVWSWFAEKFVVFVHLYRLMMGGGAPGGSKVENENVPFCAAHVAIAAFTCGGFVGAAETGAATAAVSPAATTNVAAAIRILLFMGVSFRPPVPYESGAAYTAQAGTNHRRYAVLAYSEPLLSMQSG
jgi:hypothetical protein